MNSKSNVGTICENCATYIEFEIPVHTPYCPACGWEVKFKKEMLSTELLEAGGIFYARQEIL